MEGVHIRLAFNFFNYNVHRLFRVLAAIFFYSILLKRGAAPSLKIKSAPMDSLIASPTDMACANSVVAQIMDDIAHFRLPEGDKGKWSIVYADKKRKSLMWARGVVVESRTTPVKFKWYCLASAKCKKNGTCVNIGQKPSSSNPVKHLNTEHDMRSDRTEQMSASKKKRGERIENIKDSIVYKEQPMKAVELAFTSMVVRCLLPHSLCEHEAWREYQAVASKPLVNNHMHAQVVQNNIVVLYVSLKNIISRKIRICVEDSILPVLHLMIDEWKCKQLKQRFIAIRIGLVDANFEKHSFCLSVRLYDKNQVDNDVKTAAEILLHWLSGVLQEFGIKRSMIYSATSDAGPEVRCMLNKLMGLPWEWCSAHLLTNAVKEACGQLHSQKKHGTYAEIRAVVSSINRLIAKIENSEPALANFQRICWERFGKKFVLISYMDIRFLGIVTMLERVIKLWPCLLDLYYQYYKIPFPLDFDTIEQLYGLFNSVKFIQQHAQTQSHPVTCTTLLMLLELDDHLLPGSPIKISDEKSVPSSDIVPLVERVRTALRSALEKRFYFRYKSNIPRGERRGSGAHAENYVFEMATVMHPAYKKLSCLNNIHVRMNDAEGDDVDLIKDTLKQKIYGKILSLAETVAESTASTTRRLDLTNVEHHSNVDAMADDYEDLADSVNDLSLRSDDGGSSSLVRQNFDRYMHEMGNRDRRQQKNILQWWKTKQSEYPYLSKVAQTLPQSGPKVVQQ